MTPARLLLTHQPPDGDRETAVDLGPWLRSFRYTDRSRGEADSLDIELDDTDGRFSGRGAFVDASWAFELGSRLTASLVPPHDGDGAAPAPLPLGTFEVDQDETRGPDPSVVVVGAQSAAVLGSASQGFRRHKRSAAYEGPSLRAVCAAVASRHDLALEYLAATDPPVERADQRDEADAAFLARVCDRFGLLLSVRSQTPGGALSVVIYDEAGLSTAPAVTVRRGECEGFTLPRTLHTRARAATCSYYDPAKGESVEVRVGQAETADGRTPETLTIRARVGTEAEARALATAALVRGARAGADGRLDLAPGRIDLVAGVVVQLVGFGAPDGRYLCTESSHEGSASGYRTSAQIVALPSSPSSS
ncbi:MAG: hypothetical protein CMM84_03725 [Rhodothermaceae bacterium]|nr:hypothetical protein [Rhodothermaceae bacterium]MBC15326.1 hypothetical protein [Rhodothermaceae bacterium]